MSHRIQEIQAVQSNTQQNHFHSSQPREWRTEASPWLYTMSKTCKNCSWYPVTADNPQQPCGVWYTDERCCYWAGAPSHLSCQPINCHGGAEEWRVWEQCGRVQLQQRTWHEPIVPAHSIESPLLHPTLLALMRGGELGAAALLAGCKHNSEWLTPRVKRYAVTSSSHESCPQMPCLVARSLWLWAIVGNPRWALAMVQYL